MELEINRAIDPGMIGLLVPANGRTIVLVVNIIVVCRAMIVAINAVLAIENIVAGDGRIVVINAACRVVATVNRVVQNCYRGIV